MSIINFSNTRQMEGLFDAINPIKELIESKINLSRTADREKRINLNQNKSNAYLLHRGTKLAYKAFHR